MFETIIRHDSFKNYGLALISEVEGTIMSRTVTDDGYIIKVETHEVVSYKAPLNAVLELKSATLLIYKVLKLVINILKLLFVK